MMLLDDADKIRICEEWATKDDGSSICLRWVHYQAPNHWDKFWDNFAGVMPYVIAIILVIFAFGAAFVAAGYWDLKRQENDETS